jgi:hypothetical protein
MVNEHNRDVSPLEQTCSGMTYRFFQADCKTQLCAASS